MVPDVIERSATYQRLAAHASKRADAGVRGRAHARVGRGEPGAWAHTARRDTAKLRRRRRRGTHLLATLAPRHPPARPHPQFKMFVNAAVNGFLGVASLIVSCFNALGFHSCRKP